MGWCNAYGAENPGGVGRPFGGFLNQPVRVQPVCKEPAVHRFRWVCEHGHRGSIVELCERHEGEFSGRLAAYENEAGAVTPIPWNVRRDVRSCPRCAAEAPECQDPGHAAMMRGRPGRCGCREHKCNVRLVTVS